MTEHSQFTVKPMEQGEAESVAAWHYPDEYVFYDWDQDKDDLAELLEPAKRADHYFAVYRDEMLAGFYGFKLHGNVIDVGLGLRPDLTGHGDGEEFVNVGLQFAEAMYNPDSYTLSVAAFNTRAICIYERAGFVEVERYDHWTNAATHPFVRMTRGRKA
ncbi:MAG: GNAT family N-acetyltransferase [Candidatus Nanopelagicales bacterium]